MEHMMNRRGIKTTETGTNKRESVFKGAFDGG